MARRNKSTFNCDLNPATSGAPLERTHIRFNQRARNAYDEGKALNSAGTHARAAPGNKIAADLVSPTLRMCER